MLDFGRGFWEYTEVQNAAQAGTQYAMVNGYSSTAISTAVIGATNLSGLTARPAPTQACGCPNGSSGIMTAACGSSCSGGSTAAEYVTASAQASYATIFTWPGVANPMTLAATTVVRCC